MPASFPPNLLYVKRSDDQKKNVVLIENKPEIVNLTDGRKIHLLIENQATQKPLSDDQKRNQFFLTAVVFIVIIAICMICTLIESV